MGNYNLNDEEDSLNIEKPSSNQNEFGAQAEKLLQRLMTDDYDAELRSNPEYHKLAHEHSEIVNQLESLHRAEIGRLKHISFDFYTLCRREIDKYEYKLKAKEEELIKATSKHPKLKIIFIGLSSILIFSLLLTIGLFLLAKYDPGAFDKAIKGLTEVNKTATILKDKVL